MAHLPQPSFALLVTINMHAVTICLVLLVLTCAASLLARFVKLPVPIVQIAIGLAAALPPFHVRETLDPDTFLLLFIPPLLFADGWNVSQRELLALRWPVLGHAVGLVFLTILAGGYGLHWLIPAMPLSVAFAVAALVSPTDAVAVSGMTARLVVPARMMHLLESEALLNDASGLVAMRVAVAATLSGTFSMSHAAISFVLVAVGGLATGVVLTLAYARLHRTLLTGAGDGALQTVLSGLLPFAAYAAADRLDVSGILAVVAAGMTASRVGLLDSAHFSARMQAGMAWSVIGFCLNGVIFVLLGLQLPDILGSGPVGINLITSVDRLAVLGQIGGLTALLVVVRLIWVLASVLLRRVLGAQGRLGGWRIIAAASLGGVRGAVTLAGALSLPLLMPDGTPFPSRDLAVTLATGVILSTIVIAAIALPLLLRHVRDDGAAAHVEYLLARVAAIEAAIAAVGQTGADGPAASLVAMYRQRLALLQNQTTHGETGEDRAWQKLHRIALHAERDAVQSLRLAGRVDDAVARRVLGELDVIEAALMQRPSER